MVTSGRGSLHCVLISYDIDIITSCYFDRFVACNLQVRSMSASVAIIIIFVMTFTSLHVAYCSGKHITLRVVQSGTK